MDIPEPDAALKAELGHVPATAHLAVISPSAAQGHAEAITAFPQRLAMSQLDKNTIKLVPEFSPSQLFRLFAELRKKINEIVFDKSIFCLLSNAGSSCRSCCMPRGKRMVHTLPWQLLTTAGLQEAPATHSSWRGHTPRYTGYRGTHIRAESGK